MCVPYVLFRKDSFLLGKTGRYLLSVLKLEKESRNRIYCRVFVNDNTRNRRQVDFHVWINPGRASEM